MFKIKKQNKPLVLQKTKIKIKYTFAHISFFIVNYLFQLQQKNIYKKNEAAKTKAHYDVRKNLPQKIPSDVTTVVAREF